MIKALSISYLFLLHADQLGVTVLSFNIRFSYVIALFLSFALIYRSFYRVRIDRSRIYLCFLLVLYTLLSVIWSADPKRTLAMSGLALVTLVTSYLVAYLLARYWGPVRLIRIYIGCGLLVGLYGLLQVAVSAAGFHDPFANQILVNGIVRANAFAYEPSFYILFLAPILSVMIGSIILNAELEFDRPRLVAVALFIFCAASLSASLVVLPILIIFSFLFLNRLAGQRRTVMFPKYYIRRSVSVIVWLAIVLALFAFFYIDFLNTYLFRIFLADNILEHHSSAERLVQVVNSFTVFFDAPWLGHGLGGVGQYIYDQYTGGREFVFSPSRPFEVDPGARFFDPTNVSVELLSSYGIVGSILYLSIYYCVIVDALSFIRSKSASVSDVKIIYILLISLLVLILWQNINQGLFRTYTWFFLGMLDAVRLHYQRQYLNRLNWSV